MRQISIPSRRCYNCAVSTTTKPGFFDHFVVFPSEEVPHFFEAHSLRTDQIGMGETVEEALLELFSALRDLVIEASRNTTEFNLWHPAPDEIVQRFLNTKSYGLSESVVAHITKRLAAGQSEWTPEPEELYK